MSGGWGNPLGGAMNWAPPQPVYRDIYLFNVVTPQLAGTPIDDYTLCISNITGPPNAGWFYNYPSTELMLGNNAITVVAPPFGSWLGTSTVVSIQGVRAVVPVTWNPKASWGLHELVNIQSLDVVGDFSQLTHNYRPNLNIVAPAGGAFAAPGDKVTITIEIPQDNLFARVTKTATVKVEKHTPVIKWRPIPAVVNDPLSAAQLNATTLPAAIPAFAPVLVYAPALNTPLTKAGDLALKATFAGNAWFNAASDVTVTLKVVADVAAQGQQAMLSGAAWVGPQTPAGAKLLETWETDNSPTGMKATAKKIMADAQKLTGDELEDYMDKLIGAGGAVGTRTDQPGTFRNIIWSLPNGLQVRYKPDGDGQQPPGDPPIPMFCIEGKTCPGPSTNKSQVVFKVTSAGEAGAYGPKETIVPPNVPSNKNDAKNKQYMDATIGTTHLACEKKVEQTITWTDPPAIYVGDALGAGTLNATADDKTALVYKDAAGTVLTEASTITAGKDQILSVSANATKKYLASTAPVTVKITVNKRAQTLTWPKPAAIRVGQELGAALNAKSDHDKAALSYTDANDKPITSKTVLPAGKGQVLKVRAAATDTHLAVTTPVTVEIDVEKLPQTVTWAKPAAIQAGTKLGTALNATSDAPGAALSYAKDGKPVTPDTVLPVGKAQVLTVAASATKTHEPSSASVTIDVDRRPQTLTWANPRALLAGDKLGAALNAKSDAAGAVLSYSDATGQPITPDSVLPIGKGQILKLTAAATATHEAVTVPVTVLIDVNKRPQNLTWAKPGPVLAGEKLGAALNATSNAPGAVISYADERGSPVTPETVLPPGKVLISATAAATETHDAVGKPASVSISVEKRKQTITWAKPEPIVAGDTLAAALNATSDAAGAVISYTNRTGKPVTPETVLQVGDNQVLKATASETALYAAVATPVTVAITVKAKPKEAQK